MIIDTDTKTSIYMYDETHTAEASTLIIISSSLIIKPPFRRSLDFLNFSRN